MLAPMASTLFDSITKGGVLLSNEASEISRISSAIYSTDKVFRQLSQTVSTKPRSLAVPGGADASKERMDHLFRFVRIAITKKIFSECGEPVRLYSGTWLSDDALSKISGSLGQCVILTPFNSFSLDPNVAINIPLDPAPPGGVLALLVLDFASRVRKTDEKDVSIPAFTILRVTSVTKAGGCGRAEVVLQDLAHAIFEDAKRAKPPTAIRFTVEFEGAEVAMELPAGTTVATALTLISERFDRSDISQILKDETRVSGDALIEAGRYSAKSAPPAGHEDDGEVARRLKAEADLGDAKAQVDFGLCLEDGVGVEKDPVEAARYFRLAAEQGNADGQSNYGRCLENAIGVEKDVTLAARYHKLAADQGHAGGQSDYGWCVYNGIGVEEDRAEGVRYYKLAADQGDSGGQSKLARWLENGFGFLKDTEAAEV